MVIDKDIVVSLTYSLTVDGEVVDSTDEQNPLTFLAGHGNMIPGFERQLAGKAAGDDYNFTVNSDEGYGNVQLEAIVDLPKQTFMVDGNLVESLVVGATMPMADQDGNPLRGRVMEISDETVKMDFNHPLAGKTLNFSGKVMELRKADADEIAHGHVHGPGGHHH